MPKLTAKTKAEILDALFAYLDSEMPKMHLLQMCASHASGLLEVDRKVSRDWFEPDPARTSSIVYRLRRDSDGYTSTEHWTNREEPDKIVAREFGTGLRVMRVRRTVWKRG